MRLPAASRRCEIGIEGLTFLREHARVRRVSERRGQLGLGDDEFAWPAGE